MATKTVKAVVAPRKTLHIEGKSFGPGAEVDVPADEVEFLRRSGFLVNPKQTQEANSGSGPDFGPSVRIEKDPDN